MSAQHTPGPWWVGGIDSDEVHCRIFSQDIGCNVHVKLVDAPSVGGLIPDEQLKANARLIAAAPVLLDQLRFAVALLKPIFGNTPQVESMESAIAEAIG